MALVSCPNCGRRDVSTRAENCPGCGIDVDKYYRDRRKKTVKCYFHPIFFACIIGWLGFVGFFIFFYVYFAQYGLTFMDHVIVWGFGAFAGFLTWAWWDRVQDRLCLLKNNPEYTMSEMDKIIDVKNTEEIKEYNRIRQQQKEELLENERQAAIRSQQATSPWQTRYFTEPCPYCGHYKVRYSTWDDKKMSVAFWGIWSNKVGKSFHCDKCNRTFND